jgi:myo-inositol-1(or 4)-monophosphatase
MKFETEVAIRCVGIAQAIADSRTGADRVTSKGGIDLVTDTDLACEDAIREELLRTIPGYPVVGEERAGTPVAGKPYWLVDPICGTRPFASNIPLYCTNLALVDNGEVTLAAVAIGKTGEIVWAEKGRGAQLRTAGVDSDIQVKDTSNTVWIDGPTDLTADVARELMLMRRWYVWKFSSSVAYAYLACGRISAVLQFSSKARPNPFGSVHSAAGCFIAREAGAIVSDIFDGTPWTIETQGFLISATAELHRDLSQVVRGIELSQTDLRNDALRHE